MEERTALQAATDLPARREREYLRVVLAASAFFLLLASYTMLRPVRDEMAVRFGADRLHWLFTGTFVSTLLIVPAFGWLVQRMPRAAILPAAYGLLVTNLLLFCAAFAGEANRIVAAGFFIWLSVFNLFVVSLFWSNVSDAFSTEEAHRLYGYIAAGGTAGALTGPAMTAMAARYFSTAALLASSALLLAIATLCMVGLRRHSRPGARNDALPIGGPVLAGIRLTLKSARLRGIALLVICLTTVATVLYVELIAAVGRAMPDSGERKTFFATIDLTVNVLALLLQLLGTARVVRICGLTAALSIAPFIVLTGMGALTVSSGAVAFAAVQVLHRAGEFALNKPGREMIYTTVDPETRFKAKNFVDTAVYRANDAASAWLINAIRGAGMSAIWLIGIPAALLWLLTGFRIGRQHDRIDGNGDTHGPA